MNSVAKYLFRILEIICINIVSSMHPYNALKLKKNIKALQIDTHDSLSNFGICENVYTFRHDHNAWCF